MRRYAFIDVQNTESTAMKSCGFSVDWSKLYEYLCHDRWSCQKVFFYTGIEAGDTDLATQFESLTKLSNAVVRIKPISVYKKNDKIIKMNCVHCAGENVKNIEMGYDKKANCDVELTMDVIYTALNNKDEEVELMIMTGDGDFEALIRKMSDSDAVKKIYVISSQKKFSSFGITRGRFSTKLKELIEEKKDKIEFINIDSWKYKIKKEII